MGNKIHQLSPKVRVMDQAAMERALMRLSYEIVEKSTDLSNLVLVGILTRGVPISKIIAANIRKNSGEDVPVGSLDITFYRDDLERINDFPKLNRPEVGIDINGKEVVLVDDVLFTGRTARAAIDALFAIGRPGKIRLAVLIDRGHRELPIRPDYIGKNVPTSLSEVVRVNVTETDGRANVEICEIIK